ncbi:hypothetical protein ALO_16197 [Acetonema longum DSM 6540]|uniref:Uncharacterized protein n=1 Tax=Acetonema longum DSM 6540 TaxID=1009370 RepID=F7NMB2_9FIRM|nr:hypothetical protein ALO_16197 [Acetonema longum DSM 6540]
MAYDQRGIIRPFLETLEKGHPDFKYFLILFNSF